jgi:hypothetical protein
MNNRLRELGRYRSKRPSMIWKLVPLRRRPIAPALSKGHWHPSDRKCERCGVYFARATKHPYIA